ncbi:hypothetical protein [Mucilaginibacter lacusdianchii]|uniref:hypothetical protein n=1 Tax=Mucilaginibacter lacusdianchii TaxID=2684211 RepID=UPI00131A6158|nr:hypothetical protein [Mucilaginibacter sp. JXJ CY 39]
MIGTWKLDSVSNADGKYCKADIKSFFTFKDASNYIYEWMNYDVGNNFHGKYIIVENPKRAWATISLVPDIQMSDKDTVRTEYINFDIVALSADRLHTVDQTKFIDRKGKPSIIFNKHKIYKRVVSQ